MKRFFRPQIIVVGATVVALVALSTVVSAAGASHRSQLTSRSSQLQVEASPEPEHQNKAVKQPASATPTTSTRTFVLVGGTVTFKCTGNMISLVSATPNSGFKVEIETQNGGQQIEVEFDSSTHKSEIEASCAGGQVVADEINEQEVAPAPAAPTTSTKTFALVGGTVTFRCTGNMISLVSATPNSGFKVEKMETEHGGQQIEVEFESSTHESEIEASCAGGQVVANQIKEESKDH